MTTACFWDSFLTLLSPAFASDGTISLVNIELISEQFVCLTIRCRRRGKQNIKVTTNGYGRETSFLS